MPTFLSETLAQESLSGTHTLMITLSLPEGWAEEMDWLMKRATDDYMEGL